MPSRSQPFYRPTRTKKVITFSAVICAGALAVVSSSFLWGHRRPAPVVDRVNNGWDAKWFHYDRPDKLIVEETTPISDQVNFWSRPERADPNAAPPAPGDSAFCRPVDPHARRPQ